MSRRINVSEGSARVALEGLSRLSPRLDVDRAANEFRDRLAMLDRASALKAKANATRRAFGLKSLVSHKSRKPTKAEKRDARAAIREKVFARAEGRCEGPVGSNPLNGGRCINPATDLQHAFGRGKGRMPESERNCLAACRTCHDAEGRNDPSGAAWWEWFWAFFTRNGWMREAAEAGKRANFEATRSKLGAGLKERQP